MKPFKIFLFTFWVLVLCLPFLAIGQDTGNGGGLGDTLGPIKEIFDLVFSGNFTDIVSTAGVVILAVPFIVGALNINNIKDERGRKIAKQAISWVVALILSFIAFFMNWGMFAEYTVLQTIIVTFPIGVSANLVQKTPIIEAFVDAIEKIINSESFQRKEIAR